MPDINPILWRVSVDEVVEEIYRVAGIATLATHNTNSELEEWIQELVLNLPEEPAGHFMRQALGALVTAPDAELQGLDPIFLRRRLASALIEASDVDRLEVAAGSICRLPLPHFARVLRLLEPLWVREELAKQLRVLATQQKDPGPEILLSAKHDKSAFAAVLRAFRCAREYRWWPDEAWWPDGINARQRPFRSNYLYLETSSTGYNDFPDCLEQQILECCGELEVDDDTREQRLRECSAVLTKDPQRPVFVPLPLAYRDRLDHTRYRGFVFLVLRPHGAPVADARLVVIQPDLGIDEEAKGRQYADKLHALFL